MQSEAKCSLGLDLSVLPYALAVPRIRGQPTGRFRKYKEMKKFSVRLVNGPQQIWRGSTVAYLDLQKWL